MTDLALTPSAAGARTGLRKIGLARVPVYAWLAVLVIVPNLLLLVTSFSRSAGGVVQYEPTMHNYTSLLGSTMVQFLALKTIAIAAASVALATLVAYPLAFYISRSLGHRKTIAVLLIVVPLWISLLIRIFAWRIILGEQGLLNTGLLEMGIISRPSTLFLYTPFSVVLTLSSIAIPYVFVAAYAAIERVPFSLLEAARDNGASAWRTFVTVVWPLTRQGTGVGMALAFLMAVGDYVTPSMVGGLNGTMLGMVIASQFGMAGNWPLGSAQAIYILVLIAVCLALLFLATRSRGILTEVDTGVAPVPVPWSALSPERKLRRALGRFVFLLPYVFLYAPLFVVAMFSFNDATVQTLPLRGFTLRWYADLPSNGQLLGALWKSLQLGLISSAIGAVVGTAFAFVFAGWTGRVSAAVEYLVALPLAVPGVVLGICMVMTASILGIPAGLGRLVLGHVAFVMPVVMLIVVSRLRRIDPSFALASRDLGGTPWRTFREVQLPMIQSAIIGGAILGFTLSFDEVVVSLFLTGNEPTLPVYVWNQTRFGFTPTVNAIFTCIGMCSFILVLLAQALISPAPARTQSKRSAQT